MEKLSEAALQDGIKQLDGWQLEGGELVRNLHFADFPAAVQFVNKVAEIAENAGHHPDIDIRYNRVRLALVTHDAGGITAADMKMARDLSGPLNG